jgi:hypothetical protein
MNIRTTARNGVGPAFRPHCLLRSAFGCCIWVLALGVANGAVAAPNQTQAEAKPSPLPPKVTPVTPTATPPVVPVAKPGATAARPRAPGARPGDRLSQHLAEADAAFAAKDYGRALELYRQVDAIEPTAATKLGIGASLQALGKLVEAYDVYDQLLRERGSTLARRDFEKVEQSLAALRASTAVLALQVNESNAQVTVDNLSFGTTPIDRAVRRMPGRVTVSVQKLGFEAWSQTLDLRSGEERRLAVDLVADRNLGWLTVRSAGAEPGTLQIDGKDAGPLPFSGEVPAGDHQLVAKSPRGQSSVRSISAAPKGRYEVELTIVPTPAKIHVSAVDPEATIQIDAVPVAVGHFDGELPPGHHVVTVYKPGFESRELRVAVEPGERMNLDNINLDSRDQTGKSGEPYDYTGFYGLVALDGMLGRPTHSIATDCPITSTGGSCKSWLTSGIELDSRIGYSLGLIGIEGFLLLGTTFSSAQMTFDHDLSAQESPWYGIARNERYLLINPLVAAGAAGRISSRSQSLRLSSDWGIGVAWHKGQIGRTLEATPVTQQDMIVHNDMNVGWIGGASRFLPILIWDVDVEVGNTPGLRFLFGLHCQLELGAGPRTNVGQAALGYNAQTLARLPTGGGDVQIWGSPSFFVGPRIGLAMAN